MTKNNMMCDLTTGICGEAGDSPMEFIDLNPPQKKITLYYVTDPICSHCWALEPVMRRFIAQYGAYFHFSAVMGGLLESWDGFADASNGINGPADVAGHWREVGEHSRMPIDGSLWFDNPVQSSYPPSRVFKIIQRQNAEEAGRYLRRAREAVFVFNRNIGDKQVLIDIVNQLGLDGDAIVEEAGQTLAQQLLEEDFSLARSLGVRGFPTIVMINEENKGVKIVGAQKLEHYIKALEQVLPEEKLQASPLPSLSSLLAEESLLFSKEIEVFYGLEQAEVQGFVRQELSADSFESREILGETYIGQ